VLLCQDLVSENSSLQETLHQQEATLAEQELRLEQQHHNLECRLVTWPAFLCVIWVGHSVLSVLHAACLLFRNMLADVVYALLLQEHA
jgi:hypothetical protein